MIIYTGIWHGMVMGIATGLIAILIHSAISIYKNLID